MADKCNFDRKPIGIEDAIKIRDKRNANQPYPDFRCLKCGKPVQPHAAGGPGQGARFEHRRGHGGCGSS